MPCSSFISPQSNTHTPQLLEYKHTQYRKNTVWTFPLRQSWPDGISCHHQFNDIILSRLLELTADKPRKNTHHTIQNTHTQHTLQSEALEDGRKQFTLRSRGQRGNANHGLPVNPFPRLYQAAGSLSRRQEKTPQTCRLVSCSPVAADWYWCGDVFPSQAAHNTV